MLYANFAISAARGLCRYLHVSNRHDGDRLCKTAPHLTHRLIFCTGCTGATDSLSWKHTFMISLSPLDAVIINDVACW